MNGLVRVAGVMREPREAAQLALRRSTAREKIARLDLAALAERWGNEENPEEPEDLARELCVPADLLRKALAEHLREHTISADQAPDSENAAPPVLDCDATDNSDDRAALAETRGAA